MIIEVTDETFKETIDRYLDVPIIVDFWATWCNPCLELKKILEELAQEDSDFILIKANVDNNMKIASEFAVMSLPSVKLILNNKVINEFTGVKPKEWIKQWLRSSLQ